MTPLRTSRDPDPFADLQAELIAITPSPEFAVGVRARVHAGRLRRWWVFAPAILAGGLLIAAALPVPPADDRSAAPEPTAAVTSPVAAPATPPSVAEPARTFRRIPRPPTSLTPSQMAGFEVITSQGEVLAEIWRLAPAASQRLASSLPAPPEMTLGDDGMVRVPELVVDPLVVPLINAPSGAQGRIQRLTLPPATGSPR